MADTGKPAPRPGPLAAMTTLEDIAIVTYDIDPGALATLLPPWIEPDVLTLADGRRRALISAVSFRDVDFRFRLVPFVRLGMHQVNYRAYVRTGGERAVWFLGSTLTSRSVGIPRRLWSMPWHRVDATLEATWDGTTCRSWRSTVTGSWGGMDVEVTGTTEAMGRLDGMADERETAMLLTHPLIGYYRRLDGHVAGYRVWHEPMRPTRGHAVRARFDVLEGPGLVTPGQVPHSVLLERRSEFIVYLPPTRLDGPLDG
ncbi:MAG: DUF2071 domain-containing protein [Candidatus Limnocylindrales bacterium]